jgi:phosphoglycolate phosphatase
MKLAIFDFDGTIADTMEKTAEIYNRLSHELGYRQVSRRKLAELRNRDMLHIIRYLGIPMIKLPFVSMKVHKEMRKEIGSVKAFPGMSAVMRSLKRMGIEVAIVTTNSEGNVRAFFRKNRIPQPRRLFCGTPLFGKSAIIRRALRETGFRKEEAVYVCDEVRDIRSSRKVGIKCAAVSWGYNSPRLLRKFKPDYTVRRPGDLLKVLR